MIKSVYPEPASALTPEAAGLLAQSALPSRRVDHRGSSEIVLAVDLATLTVLAQRHGGMIEFLPQVGDFRRRGRAAVRAPRGSDGDRRPRASVGGGLRSRAHARAGPDVRIPDHRRHRAEGLSAAINDPTTAVLALDQVHRLLRLVGMRKLRGEVLLDDDGQPRVIFRTPNWEDYVHVACSEIRACGANNLQVVRRMRANAREPGSTLPEHRRAALETELQLLDWAIQQHFHRPEELALARIADSQGLGSSSTVRSRLRSPEENAPIA
jgi:uncharacterized membrane protein